jgi:hypothetical protein
MQLRYRWIARIAIAALFCAWAAVLGVAVYGVARGVLQGRAGELLKAPPHELLFFVIGVPIVAWWALQALRRLLAGSVAASCDAAELTIYSPGSRLRIPLGQIVAVRIEARRLGDVFPMRTLVVTTSTAAPTAGPAEMARARRKAIRIPLAGIKGGMAAIQRFHVFLETARHGMRRYETEPGMDPPLDALGRLLLSEARVGAVIRKIESERQAGRR